MLVLTSGSELAHVEKVPNYRGGTLRHGLLSRDAGLVG